MQNDAFKVLTGGFTDFSIGCSLFGESSSSSVVLLRLLGFVCRVSGFAFNYPIHAHSFPFRIHLIVRLGMMSCSLFYFLCKLWHCCLLAITMPQKKKISLSEICSNFSHSNGKFFLSFKHWLKFSHYWSSSFFEA